MTRHYDYRHRGKSREAEPEADAPGLRAAGGEPLAESEKYERNALCPCGSGRKAKKCHEGRPFQVPGATNAAPDRYTLGPSASNYGNECQTCGHPGCEGTHMVMP